MQELEGARFGQWTVLRKDTESKSRDTRWICRCDCGVTKSVLGKYLKNGKSQSCGCAKKKDLSGQKFGKLLVLETIYGYKGYDRATYKCQCDCGNTVIVTGRALTSGNTTSCGCYRSDLRSKNEQIIAKILSDEYIEFVRDKTFDDCIGVGGKKLRFDFYIPSFDLAIEYDGKQHYEPIDFFGGEERFEVQKQNDKIKDNYCEANSITLIRISYKNKTNDIYNILHNIIFSNPVTTKVS